MFLCLYLYSEVTFLWLAIFTHGLVEARTVNLFLKVNVRKRILFLLFLHYNKEFFHAYFCFKEKVLRILTVAQND